MKKEKERERRPHCKICGHFHFGLCSECVECTRGNQKPEEKPDVAPVAVVADIPAPERLSAEEITDRLAAIDVRLTELEQSFEKIDKRREYQKLLMRRRRKAKKKKSA